VAVKFLALAVDSVLADVWPGRVAEQLPGRVLLQRVAFCMLWMFLALRGFSTPHLPGAARASLCIS